MSQLEVKRGHYGLDNHGISQSTGKTFWNLTAPELVEEAVRRYEGELAATGPFCAVTSPYTGRSPNDKFVVEEPSSKDKIWWGKVNQSISEEHYDRLREKVVDQLSNVDRFVADVHIGADARYRVPLRVVTEKAWVAMFVRNMFIVPDPNEVADHVPEFTVLHAPNVRCRATSLRRTDPLRQAAPRNGVPLPRPARELSGSRTSSPLTG